MLGNNHLLCSGCHLCFKLNIFYGPDAIYVFSFFPKEALSMFWMPFMHLCLKINIFYVQDAIYVLEQIFSQITVFPKYCDLSLVD